jgi:hypothetical protein
VANSRHSEQIIWRNENAVRILQDEYIDRRGGWAKALVEIKADFPNAVRFEREMEKKEFR